jgi:hypothetical protein
VFSVKEKDKSGKYLKLLIIIFDRIALDIGEGSATNALHPELVKELKRRPEGGRGVGSE